MGNVMETCRVPMVLNVQTKRIRAAAASHKTAGGYDADDDCGTQKAAPSPPGGKGKLKVKIVLTKAELEWLMSRFKEEKDSGVDGAALEQALVEIQKGRKRDGVKEKQGRLWKPSLERIMESPETQHIDDECLDK